MNQRLEDIYKSGKISQLNNQFIGNAGVIALLNSPYVEELKELHLEENNLTDESVIAIAKSPKLEKLEMLTLARNQITDVGALALANSKTLVNLKELDLNFNQIENQGAIAIARAEIFSNLEALKLGQNNYVITLSPKQNEPNEIRVVTRSLLGVLFYLSQAVEVPEQDIREGKVTRTIKTSGEIFDWKEVTGELLTIRSDSSRPENATLMVFYRGTWFYIDDSDLKSKSTFSLLSQIFSLQAGKIKDTTPLLTLPVGQ